uniref:Uncharacterized protein n=1 Tax=Ditylenchus dipsaci TaxID=166011 RepID=A0A915EE69_9BILA
MGGWEELKRSGGVTLLLQHEHGVHATAQLFKHKHDIPMTLYSSHAIKKVFIGGSINVNNCEECVKLIFDQEVPQLQLIKKATLSWDTHLIERMPFMLKRIGDGNQGRQFCQQTHL